MKKGIIIIIVLLLVGCTSAEEKKESVTVGKSYIPFCPDWFVVPGNISSPSVNSGEVYLGRFTKKKNARVNNILHIETEYEFEIITDIKSEKLQSGTVINVYLPGGKVLMSEYVEAVRQYQLEALEPKLIKSELAEFEGQRGPSLLEKDPNEIVDHGIFLDPFESDAKIQYVLYLYYNENGDYILGHYRNYKAVLNGVVTSFSECNDDVDANIPLEEYIQQVRNKN